MANKAYISLVPTGAQTLDEFRPISVITGVIKIISKILAPLHEIFSENQTANIRRGRLATSWVETSQRPSSKGTTRRFPC